MKTFTKEMQDNITPDAAFDLLKEGNERFVSNSTANRNLLEQADETSGGQHPFAVILSCIDSRTSSEHIFDLGFGDAFNVRIAGNIINEDILGSMEFGCKAAGSKVIAVLGHSGCGAVKGACDNVELGNLTGLLTKICPAVDDEKTVDQDRSSANPEFVKKVTILNVKKVIDDIQAKSPIIKEMIDNNEVKIVGGYHELATGKVAFDI
ncbi:MAG: carbonic anhydrase family protein [Pseudomonadota bacterium]